jgi:cell division protein FtsQ
MLKKILAIAGLCVLGGYLIFAIFFFEKKPKEQVCSRFDINISNGAGDRFVDAADLEKFIEKQNLNPYGKQLKDINTYNIQQALLSNKLIKSADVYVTGSGGVRAVIVERVPVLRVMPSGSSGYYIDEEGESMPLSNLNTAYLPVATGNITEDFAEGYLFRFAVFLRDNKFWNAQIEQIAVRSEKDVVLITRVGNQEILMGSLDNYEIKLSKLKTFYDKVLPKTGWNMYSQINLKFDKQVIGVKR